MSRIRPLREDELNPVQTEDHEELVRRDHVTHMQRTLIRDRATYRAYDAWHLSWDRLVEVVGERAATVFAHAISETNGCQLCSLYFVADLRALGVDPHDYTPTEEEKVLADLAQAIVRDPSAVPDDVFDRLLARHGSDEVVVIVGFAGQMIATNTFNSVLQVDLDGRLLPLRDAAVLSARAVREPVLRPPHTSGAPGSGLAGSGAGARTRARTRAEVN
ncbi:MAG: carboxymuconolactone decarboxylase family protein [Pauljensenia sp.]